MRRRLLSVLLGLALAGCTQPQAPSTPELPSASEEGEANTAVIDDIHLYLHDTRPTGGQALKPTLHLQAKQGTQVNESTWSFNNAYAIIYDKSRNDEEQGKLIEIWAQEGRFEEGKSAYLKGSVKAVLGDMTIELSDIEWQNPDKDKPGEARSDSPVKLSSPQMQLQANSLRIYPDNKEFELVGVTGSVDFGRQEQ